MKFQNMDLVKNIDLINKLDKYFDNSLERFAFILSQLLYRNTIIENYHSQGVICNEQVYKSVYKEVSKGCRILIKNREILKILLGNRPIYNIVKYAEDDCFINSNSIKLVRDIFYYFSWTNDWDKPILLDIEVLKDKASFIIGGKFTQACNEGWELNDDVMCIINKDVCNRIYTLLVNEWIN